MGRLLAIAAIITLAPAAAAQASTLAVEGTYTLSGSAYSDPGLVIETYPSPGSPNSISTTLTEGSSNVVALFDIWTDETWVNGDDTVPQTLQVSFDLTSPDVTGLATGTTVGTGLIIQGGVLQWGQPLEIAYGGDNPGLLSIVLNNATFNWGLFGLNEGQAYGATVYGTLSFTSSPVANPIPGALVMLLSGLGFFGWFGFRRHRAANLA